MEASRRRNPIRWTCLEAVDRYQINKAPLQHMCGEAVLSQLNPPIENCCTLLSKYAGLMSEESNKKAANKVATIMDGDLESYYDEACQRSGAPISSGMQY